VQCSAVPRTSCIQALVLGCGRPAAAIIQQHSLLYVTEPSRSFPTVGPHNSPPTAAAGGPLEYLQLPAARGSLHTAALTSAYCNGGLGVGFSGSGALIVPFHGVTGKLCWPPAGSPWQNTGQTPIAAVRIHTCCAALHSAPVPPTGAVCWEALDHTGPCNPG
jgi:hypothetical protein